MSVGDTQKEEIRSRSNDRCEYCGLHQETQDATFHIEHIIPRKRGGSSNLDNLANSCVSCNFAKKVQISARDPVSGDIVPLFHPRRDVWSEHFAWKWRKLRGVSAIGRATIVALKMDSPNKLRVFRAQVQLGLYPP